MDYNKIEDAVFKKAMKVFKEGAAEFFDLDVKIIASAETEIKNIDIKTNVMDYLFYTDSGDYLHFEFQTTDKREDISRFLYSEITLESIEIANNIKLDSEKNKCLTLLYALFDKFGDIASKKRCRR